MDNGRKSRWRGVLLSDAKMFLLDEPTASMDPIGESKLYEDMMNVMKDRGVIIVTHRLALEKDRRSDCRSCGTGESSGLEATKS